MKRNHSQVNPVVELSTNTTTVSTSFPSDAVRSPTHLLSTSLTETKPKTKPKTTEQERTILQEQDRTEAKTRRHNKVKTFCVFVWIMPQLVCLYGYSVKRAKAFILQQFGRKSLRKQETYENKKEGFVNTFLFFSPNTAVGTIASLCRHTLCRLVST